MRTPHLGLITAASLLLALGACGPRGGSRVAESQPAPSREAVDVFPASLARELVPSGIRVLRGPPGAVDPSDQLGDDLWPWGQIVADGAGQVWLDTAGLTRLDPRSGQSTSWDEADDAAFGSFEALAPADGPGVWLLGQDRVWLFDGQRFDVDLQVPPKLLTSGGGPGPDRVGHVHDVATVGAEIWLSLHDVVFPGVSLTRRIVRWSAGTWTLMTEGADGIVGDLAADRDGNVWTGGWGDGEAEGLDSEASGVSRWDGRTWSVPGAGSDQVQGTSGAVVADPTGGVWLLAASEGEDGSTGAVSRFDGSSWVSRGTEAVTSGPDDDGDLLGVFQRDVSLEDEGSLGTVTEYPAGLWLAVSASGDGWLAGPGGVARIPSDGASRTFGLDAGFATPIRGIATAGRDVVVADLAGVVRWDGDRFTRIWTDPSLDTPATEGLVAVSSEEVWVWGEDYPSGHWYRYREGTWQIMVADARAECHPVLASDGAIWTITSHELTRLADGRSRLVAAGVPDCPVFAGPGDGVWVPGGDGLISYRADGTSATARIPDLVEVCDWSAGSDGSVWIRSPDRRAVDEGDDPDDDEYCSDYPNVLRRWDGASWVQVDSPQTTGPVVKIVIADDGAAWAVSTVDGLDVLSRYTQGTWTTVRRGIPPSLKLSAASGGRVCALELDLANADGDVGDSIACYGDQGEVARFDHPNVTDFSVAPDGAVWVDEARLAQRLPSG